MPKKYPVYIIWIPNRLSRKKVRKKVRKKPTEKKREKKRASGYELRVKKSRAQSITRPVR